MKLLTFHRESDRAAEPRVGASVAEGVVDLTAVLAQTHPDTPAGSLLSIIQSGVDIDAIGEDGIAQLRSSGSLAQHVVADVRWLPPVLRPPKILALALNFQEHIDETSLEFHGEPIVFGKYPSNLIATGDTIELPPFPQKVDEELELAVVVGKDCRHIRPSEAVDAIFGYTICNDVSARDRQRERSHMGQPYAYAKNFATFCPMGPWVVTKKELPDPHNLAMEVRVNGETRRSGSTANMIFDAYEVLAYCSDYTQMEAGDIISLGTFAGDKELHDGDELELEIEKIGVLRNRVAASAETWANFAPGERTGPMVREYEVRP